ncbi:MAG TPA: helix-turn-helix transcriptional regulator [Mesotoga sp.]|nr:helix-turn-helix transcriptional regulator [Mesotoga sp.]
MLDKEQAQMASIIGAFIRKNRKSLGLTSDVVSEMCEVDNSTISQIENGKRVPKLETIVRIVSFFMRVAEKEQDNIEERRLMNSVKELLRQLCSIYKEVD